MAKMDKPEDPDRRSRKHSAEQTRPPEKPAKAAKERTAEAKPRSTIPPEATRPQASQTAQRGGLRSGDVDVGKFSVSEAKEVELNIGAEAASTLKGSGAVFDSTVEQNQAAQQTFETPDSAAARAYTKFDSDRPRRHAEDRLDITPDVEAFAELICLKETKPPLSIGLFGDWGSGKSFFMQKLSEKIEELTKPGDDVDDGGPFVSNVVQIKFNAWHTPTPIFGRA